MEFPYGIFPESLVRWVAFERIGKIQAERGGEVGWAAMKRIVDRELEAIEEATAAREQSEMERLQCVGDLLDHPFQDPVLFGLVQLLPGRPTLPSS